jgi:hypothetical protein
MYADIVSSLITSVSLAKSKDDESIVMRLQLRISGIEINRLQESRVSQLRSSDANILSQNANGCNAKRHRHIEYDIANPHKPKTTTYHDSYATALPDSRHLGKIRLKLIVCIADIKRKLASKGPCIEVGQDQLVHTLWATAAPQRKLDWTQDSIHPRLKCFPDSL